MLRNIMAEVDVKAGIQSILQRIDHAYKTRPSDIKTAAPMLVAVSKTKPVELIIEAYSAGQRHFGENYVQELVEKGHNPEILNKCPEIKWHFIGHLQNNKINKVLKVPKLYMIETVHDQRLADALDKAWQKIEMNNKEPLRVMIQVNTSGEEAKNGVHPSEAPKLYKHVVENLKNLKTEGVMTIGAFGHDYEAGPNPDFISLVSVHKTVCEENHLDSDKVHISMGMSDDFEKAIEMGSTIVRVGSSIFGYRAKKNA